MRDIPPYKLPKPSYCTDWPFYYAQIRDTKLHYGMRWNTDWKVVSNLKSFSKATILIANDLDQPIRVTIEGSLYKDFRWYDTMAVWTYRKLQLIQAIEPEFLLVKAFLM
jgi:hypothetical protein